MAVLIMLAFLVAGFYHLGRLVGERREKERHARAVTEATGNITSLEGWRER